jgi:hypothetical protein
MEGEKILRSLFYCIHYQPIGISYNFNATNQAPPLFKPKRGKMALSARLAFFYLFLVMTLVIACLMVMPAFSISFRDSPVVMLTFRAGCNCQPISFGVA